MQKVFRMPRCCLKGVIERFILTLLGHLWLCQVQYYCQSDLERELHEPASREFLATVHRLSFSRLVPQPPWQCEKMAKVSLHFWL